MSTDDLEATKPYRQASDTVRASHGKAADVLLGRALSTSTLIKTENFNRGNSATLSLAAVKLMVLAGYLCLFCAFVLPLAVMSGWIFSIDALKRLFLQQLINFPTAFWLAFLTLATVPVVTKISHTAVRAAGRTGLAICALVGTTLWLEHLLGQDWNLNSNIYQPPGNVSALSLPGQLSVDTSFCLALVALTALALDFLGTKRPLLYQFLSLMLGIPGFFLVLAYSFGATGGVERFCAMQGCVVFKFFTYLIFCLLDAAMFLSFPTQGITRVLAIDTVGGKFFRLSILGMISFLPIACLLQQGVKNEIFDLPSALILAMIAISAEVVALFAYSARKIDKIGQAKQDTENSLAELSASQDNGLNYKMLCLMCGKEFPDSSINCPSDGTKLDRIIASLAAGCIIAGKYEIIDTLGSGGMSTVYLAKHKLLQKDVAVKMLRASLASDPLTVQRFQMEAKAAFDLNHPNLLAVYDFGISQHGQAYIVMDYLEGESLAAIADRDERISLLTALPLFYDISRGLAHAHEHGVLHRDIKPGNVMVIRGEKRLKAVIVDFGLIKTYDSEALKLTQTGEIFGSPLYMSPEQCRGINLDNRSDIYSLGCLFYEVLSGIPPILGASAYETTSRKFTDTPKPFDPVLKIPEWLSDLVMAMLSVKPDDRPASARIVTDSLAKFISQEEN